jgi:hypothetical protein
VLTALFRGRKDRFVPCQLGDLNLQPGMRCVQTFDWYCIDKNIILYSAA